MFNEDLTRFIDHLEFLGYGHLKKESDKITVYFFKHHINKRLGFIMVPFYDIDTILFRASIDIKKEAAEQKSNEISDYVNNFNKENILYCCYIENGSLIIRTTISCKYNKQLFGAMFNDFSMNIESLSNKFQNLNFHISDQANDIFHDTPLEEQSSNNYCDHDYYIVESCYCDALDYDCGDRPPCDYDGDYVDEYGNYSDNPCYHNDDYS